MTLARAETTHSVFFTTQVNQVIDPVLPQFESLMKSYVTFNLLFIVVGTLEINLLLLFFTILVKSSILAISLGIVFFTFFSYFILRLYYQAKKPEQFKELRDRYVHACKGLLNYQEGVSEHHIALANACCKLANSLHGKEYNFYKLPQFVETYLPSLTSLMDKFSCWWLWQDVHKMKELLLSAAVEENIKLVKSKPTSLDAHVSLANAYVMLSGLYADPQKIEGYDEDRWLPPERFSSLMEQKFRQTAEKAIEEFKILIDYAPEDPWVHAQLAYSYHDLQMPQEEIKEYETILKINPDDQDTHYKLGLLYFQQGLNSKGLRVYEELKRKQFKKADSLLKFYGAEANH